MTCDNCIHGRVCGIKAFPDAFENTQWEKEPCDHFKSKSEWISVEERLPSKSGKYLVCTQRGNVYQTKFYSHPENKGGHWGQKDKGRNITHWMPLPEAPKMKGGE